MKKVQIIIGSALLFLLCITACMPVAYSNGDAESAITAAPSTGDSSKQISTTKDDTACLNDEFSQSDIESNWNWVDPEGTSSYNLSDHPGFLRILDTTGNHDLNSGNMQSPRLMRGINGDFSLETHLIVDPTLTYQSAGILVWINDNNFVWIGRSVDNVIGHNYFRDGSNEGLNPEQVPYNSQSVYFRVERVGETINTFYSADGNQFTQTGSIQYTGLPQQIDAGIFVINNWQTNPFYADFDYVKITCDDSAQTAYQNNNVNNSGTTMEKTVFTVAYVDVTPFYDPEEHQEEFIEGLKEGSTWHGYENPNGVPALQYHTYNNKVLYLYETPPHRADTGQFDYAALYQRFDLCNKIRAGEVDEVWVWESGDGNAWEWVTNGPQWSWVNDSNVPNCGRTVTSMNLNYQREIDVAYESFSHRIEGAMMTNHPCEFYTATWPWTNAPSSCGSKLSDRYGFVARPFAGNDYVANCGDVHSPPNILTDNTPYIYDSTSYAKSDCDDWQMDGSGTVKTINCTEWGCTHKGYHIWWMQNLPGIGNDNHDESGNLMPNWWTSLF